MRQLSGKHLAAVRKLIDRYRTIQIDEIELALEQHGLELGKQHLTGYGKTHKCVLCTSLDGWSRYYNQNCNEAIQPCRYCIYGYNMVEMPKDTYPCYSHGTGSKEINDAITAPDLIQAYRHRCVELMAALDTYNFDAIYRHPLRKRHLKAVRKLALRYLTITMDEITDMLSDIALHYALCKEDLYAMAINRLTGYGSPSSCTLCHSTGKTWEDHCLDQHNASLNPCYHCIHRDDKYYYATGHCCKHPTFAHIKEAKTSVDIKNAFKLRGQYLLKLYNRYKRR